MSSKKAKAGKPPAKKREVDEDEDGEEESEADGDVEESEPGTALVVAGEVGISAQKKAKAMAGGGALSFLKLVAMNADMDELPAGAKPGCYLLRGEKVIESDKDSGGFIAVFPLTKAGEIIIREHAQLWAKGECALESFNSDDADWKKIAATRKSSDQGAPRKSIGSDMLMWLPEYQCFASQPMMNSHSRQLGSFCKIAEAKKPVLVRSKVVKAKGNKWWVPIACDDESGDRYPLPTREQQADAIAAFEAYKLEKKAEPVEGERPR